MQAQIEFKDADNYPMIVLISANGTKYKLTVSDLGILTTEVIA